MRSSTDIHLLLEWYVSNKKSGFIFLKRLLLPNKQNDNKPRNYELAT